MPWLVDDLAGAAIGPWGLAVAAGIGVGAFVTRRLGPTLAGAASGATAGAAAGVTGTRDQVRERVSSTLTDLRSWWSDVYAEAYAEWEQSRVAGGGTAVAAVAAPVIAEVARTTAPPTSVVRTGAPRVRGTNGRYSKIEPA